MGGDRDFDRDRGYDRNRHDRDGGPDRGGARAALSAPPIQDRPSTGQKPLKSSGFSPFPGAAKARENSLQFAGHPGVALLNDALLRGLFRTQHPGA